MTPEQENRVGYLLGRLFPDEAHHGCCVGADAQFDRLVLLCSSAEIVPHPPDNSALVSVSCIRANARAPKPYLERNRDIVDETDVLIACPKGFEEEQRSGTWATVRWARGKGKPVYIVWPDGSVKQETRGADLVCAQPHERRREG